MSWEFPYEFGTPWALLLFLLFIPFLWKDALKTKSKGVPMPSIEGLEEDHSLRWINGILRFSKYIILSGLILALARPRSYQIVAESDEGKGIDIMLSVDVSLSMLAQDLNPDRLTALKDIAVDFVDKRPGDRIGLVAYSGEAYTKVPLTTEHSILNEEIKQLYPNELAQGTSIGEGLSVAISHLEHSKAKSKVIILMTDGVNTVQNMIPAPTAAKLAADLGIKVYTIGIGTNGFALMPTHTDIFGDLVFRQTEVTIDEPLLKEIAQITGGKYFRATSNRSLQKVYEEINTLEKTNISQNKQYAYTEYFRWPLGIALLVFLIDILLRWVLFKKLR